MRKLFITRELIEDYYENRFQKDLAGCFLIRKNEDGIKVVDIKRPFPGIFYNHEPTEKQILFIAMTSFMLSAEEKLMWKVPDLQTSKLYDFLNAFGFPVFPFAARRYGLEDMLKYFEIDRELWSTDEVETLRDAMKLVEPFMLSKLRSHLETWNHGSFDYLLDEGIEDAAKHQEADVVTVRPRETYLIPSDGKGPASVRIITLESTDMGVAFYIEAEGKRIYHAGDLNVWFWNDEPMEDNIASEKKCRGEMQYLADRIREENSRQGEEKELPDLLDAAFVPLDPRLEEHAPRCIAAFMEILGAKYVFPMHYWSRLAETREYLKDPRIEKYAARLLFDQEVSISGD